MRPIHPTPKRSVAAALGIFVCAAAFFSLLPAATATESLRDADLVLRPTHRHGADPLDPHAAWFVSSYTATEPLVPHLVLDGALRGLTSSKVVADPLRRSAEAVLWMQ